MPAKPTMVSVMRGRDAPARATAALALFVASLAVALLCCQGLLSIDGAVIVAGSDASIGADSGGADAEAGAQGMACGLAVDAGGCQVCVAASCCGQAATCAADPACAALESCLLGCGGDYGCRATCGIAHPVGDTTDVPTLDTCVAAHCNGACGMVCGTADSFTSPDAADGCQTCMAANCATVMACASDLQCELTEHCASSCATQDCRNACLLTDDAGFVSMAFAQAACLPACQIGRDWRCVGKVAFPFAKATTSVATLLVTDGATSSPLQGLSVSACEAGEDPCSSLATGTTDAQGSVTLQLPDLAPDSVGFDGYFEITSTAQPPSIVPFLYFLSYPLSEAHATLQVGVQSSANLQSLVALVGVTLDMTHGIIAVSATDCLLLPSPGVTIAADPTDSETRLIYVANGVLSATATSTDLSGGAFFLNASAQMVSVAVTPIGLGRVSSQTSLFVRAGAISFIEALPTP